jgi:alkylated DNA repair dioxygenase AlkB
MASEHAPLAEMPLVPGTPVVEIEGFRYEPDVIDEAEELALLEAIGRVELRPFVFRGVEARRRVAAFGFGYSFDRRSLTDAPPLPDFLLPLAERVAPLAGGTAEEFGEALITEYPVGAGIGWHRDAPPFGVIVGISLLSPCTFRMRPSAAAGVSRRAVGAGHPVSVALAPRSAYVLAGPARTEWEHSIPEAITRRYSITFRTLRRSRARR